MQNATESSHHDLEYRMREDKHVLSLIQLLDSHQIPQLREEVFDRDNPWLMSCEGIDEAFEQ